uniref:Reverse transcriptase domain-containing protein n=1 Tax=Cacopsylla melanoneura TaxID=428564 RepID=A0A8D9BBV5_9HEMI
MRSCEREVRAFVDLNIHSGLRSWSQVFVFELREPEPLIFGKRSWSRSQSFYRRLRSPAINSNFSTIKHSGYLLYADDLKIYKSISKPSDIALLQSDLNSIQLWLNKNKLSFCPQKCEYVQFTRKRTTIPSSYTINNVPLKLQVHKKDLGVTFSKNLSFNDHIENVALSSLKILGFVMRTLHRVDDPDSFLLLYKSLVLSKLSYASVVWMPTTGTYRHLLETVQASFCRRLFFRLNGFYPVYPEGISYSDLREHLSLPSIESHHKITSLQILHRIMNNRIDSMDLVSDVCLVVPSIRTRALNNVSLFYIPNNSFTSISPLYQILKLYNRCHRQLDLSLTFDGFARAVVGVAEFN